MVSGAFRPTIWQNAIYSAGFQVSMMDLCNHRPSPCREWSAQIHWTIGFRSQNCKKRWYFFTSKNTRGASLTSEYICLTNGGRVLTNAWRSKPRRGGGGGGKSASFTPLRFENISIIWVGRYPLCSFGVITQALLAEIYCCITDVKVPEFQHNLSSLLFGTDKHTQDQKELEKANLSLQASSRSMIRDKSWPQTI